MITEGLLYIAAHIEEKLGPVKRTITATIQLLYSVGFFTCVKCFSKISEGDIAVKIPSLTYIVIDYKKKCTQVC